MCHLGQKCATARVRNVPRGSGMCHAGQECATWVRNVPQHGSGMCHAGQEFDTRVRNVPPGSEMCHSTGQECATRVRNLTHGSGWCHTHQDGATWDRNEQQGSHQDCAKRDRNVTSHIQVRNLPHRLGMCQKVPRGSGMCHTGVYRGSRGVLKGV
jgi:hypothetical protein